MNEERHRLIITDSFSIFGISNAYISVEHLSEERAAALLDEALIKPVERQEILTRIGSPAICDALNQSAHFSQIFTADAAPADLASADAILFVEIFMNRKADESGKLSLRFALIGIEIQAEGADASPADEPERIEQLAGVM